MGEREDEKSGVFAGEGPGGDGTCGGSSHSRRSKAM